MNLPKWAKCALEDINKNFKRNNLYSDIIRFSGALSDAHNKIDALEERIQLQNIVIESLERTNQ